MAATENLILVGRDKDHDKIKINTKILTGGVIRHDGGNSIRLVERFAGHWQGHA